MLVQSLFFLGVVVTVHLSAEIIQLEWLLGSSYPVSRVINSGIEQDLYCSVKDTNQQYPVLLLCPLETSICMENCNRHEDNLHISCKNISTDSMIIFHYKIKVFKKYEGEWKCQYKTTISRTVQLTVTNKPYISSFMAVPNPVWQGSPLNVTCQAMVMPGVSGIQLSRLSSDNSTSVIQRTFNEITNPYSQSVIIDSATPGKDNNIQCMVFTNTGMISTKLLNIDIFYLPERLQLSKSSIDDSFPVGFLLSFKCTAVGGRPRPVLSLYRRRQNGDTEKLIETSIILSKLDNRAIFYCKMDKIAEVEPNIKSNQLVVKVRYPPDNIELREDPVGQLIESQVQTFVCLTRGGSEPPSQIEWSMADHFGRNISFHDLNRIIDNVKPYNLSSGTLKDSIQITIQRNLNGYSISCSVVYEHKQLYTQKRLIKVAFAPNTITLNSNPLGAIVQGTSIILTCTTGTANPPSKIQWSKTKPGQKSEDVTSYSNMDLIPANFSGVAISSTLNIHDVDKGDHGNLYRCIVSHAYINSEIIKEYILNVLFPPIIQVYSYPYPAEEGEHVFMQCRTSGGNPNNLTFYRFQWQFCPVNNTYQIQSDQMDMVQKPNSDIRKYCSRILKGLHAQQWPTLNLSSVSSKQRGWYSCRVHSPGGSTIGYSFLNVLYPPQLTRLSPERIYGKSSTDILLKFEVSSNPLEIDVKWFFRPQKKPESGSISDPLYESNMQAMSGMKKQIVMKPFGRLESVVFENYTVYLLIRSISYLDYGDYSCEVSNRIGKKWIQFKIFPANDITIPETSIGMQFKGRNVVVQYEPPTQGHFTHLILRICSLEGSGNCKDMHILNPLSGKATTTLHRSPTSFSYRILVYNGSSLLQVTNPIQRNFAVQTGNLVEMSFEMMIAVIIGVVGIFVLLFAALLTLILLKCKQNKSKEDLFVENNSIVTTNGNRRHDYFLLNSSANTTLMKNGCHCFPNYPLELRSENGSDHSAPSQDTRIYHPIMMRRKPRDAGEMNSVHSGGSCQNPDVILTEKTSIGSGNNQNFSGTPQFSSLDSSTPNKVSFLSGRLHSFDGQRQDLSMPEDFAIPQNMVFAAVDDGTNQTRLIPIATKNLHSEYPLYYQMNNQTTPKQYDSGISPVYSMSLPHCTKPCRNDTYHENSSSTNTDSNQYSTANEPSVVDTSVGAADIIKGDIN